MPVATVRADPLIGLAASAGAVPTAPAADCFHCGQAVPQPPRHWVSIDATQRPLCCAGCQAVAGAIVERGLGDYYRHRNAPAMAPSDPDAARTELQRLGLYDDEQVQQQYVHCAGEDRECTLAIEGIRCGACVWLIERTLRALPGVRAASVNYASGRATVHWQAGAIGLSRILASVRSVGYRALPFDARARELARQQSGARMFRRLFIAGLGMMQVMMYAVPVYLAGAAGIEPEYEQLMRWASFALTLPVLLYSAAPFFAGAWRDLRSMRPGMDTPVALGIAAAFGASTWTTIVGRGEVYFDSVTMFVFLLLLARHLESRMRERASRAIDMLAAALPDSVRRIGPDGSVERIAALNARPGDRLLIAHGERIALDATLVEGFGSIDQSLLTGESAPVAVAPGAELPGGSINAGNPITVQALRSTRDSAPSVVQRLIDRAAGEKPRAVALADTVAAWFSAALLLFATAAYCYWRVNDPGHAMAIAIAILVVSCPCALSLATPAALAAATGSLLDRGLLITRGHAIESLARVTDVVFDKTGTLTEGRPELIEVELAARWDSGSIDRALALAVALEAGSSHPFARALMRAWQDHAQPGTDVPLQVRSPVVHPGRGVTGTIDGVRYGLGSAEFLGIPDQEQSGPARAGDASRVWLARLGPDADGNADCDGDRDGNGHDCVPLACFVLRDRLRPDAKAVIDRLRQAGLVIHLLSGDQVEAVECVATQLAIDAWRAGTRPAGKIDYVRALQQQGRRVLMAGDGINDAPVLAASDVSIAVHDAADLAQTAADLVALRPGVQQIEIALTQARRARGVVRQNLIWASLYNGVAIPAAALGWVSPWMAAIGMSASSLLVALNALRLWSWKRSTC